MSEEYIEEGINGQWTDWKFEAENYKKICEHLQQENKQLKEELELKSGMNIAVQNLKLIEENKQLTDLQNNMDKRYEKLEERINKATKFYTHELFKREQLGVPQNMPWESVEMFNILEGNK